MSFAQVEILTCTYMPVQVSATPHFTACLGKAFAEILARVLRL
jgi:hypothetical protein